MLILNSNYKITSQTWSHSQITNSQDTQQLVNEIQSETFMFPPLRIG